MGDQDQSRFVSVVLNGVALLGFGLSLTGWLNPTMGVAVMGCALIYWTWELLRQPWVTKNIPGMFRFLMVIMLWAVIIGAAGPKVAVKLNGPSTTSHDSETPSQGSIAHYSVNSRRDTDKQPTSRSAGPPHLTPGKRPHMRILGLNKPSFSVGDRLHVEVVLENNGEEDADVLTTAGLLRHEVYADLAARRRFEDSLFDKTRELPQHFDNPATHTFPVGAKRTLPIEQPWVEQWNEHEAGSSFAVYVKGTVHYRSRTDHRYIKTAEFCKYILDNGTLVECAGHNVDP